MAHCACATCCSNMWGKCDKVWGGGACEGCIYGRRLNHYMGEAWGSLVNHNFPPQYAPYSFLCSWGNTGNDQEVWVGGTCFYINWTCTHTYLLYKAKMVPAPPSAV